MKPSEDSSVSSIRPTRVNIYQVISRIRVWVVPVLLGVVLASWVISLWQPHGFTITRWRQYALVCHGGVIQFRYAIRTAPVPHDQIFTSIEETGFNPPGQAGHGRVPSLITWGAANPRVLLSPWRMWSTAKAVTGGQVPIANGQYAEFGDRTQIWGFPHWLAAAVFAIPTAWLILRWPHRRSVRRRAQGLCVQCGYNLTGNISGICPECGKRIQPALQAVHTSKP